MSALAVYDRVLFWPAAVQNILLDLFAPLGLALGDPFGLAAPRGPAGRALRSRPGARADVSVGSSVLVLASETDHLLHAVLPTALGNGPVRQLMHLQLLLTGCCSCCPCSAGRRLLPRWCTHPVRAVLVFVDGLFDSVPGIVVMFTAPWWPATGTTPRTAGSLGALRAADQMLGGGAHAHPRRNWSACRSSLLVFVEWWRTERERTVELDARLDREAPLNPLPAAGRPGPAGARSAPDGARRPPVPAARCGSPRLAPPPAAPECTRPWWETDQGEVGTRARIAISRRAPSARRSRPSPMAPPAAVATSRVAPLSRGAGARRRAWCRCRGRGRPTSRPGGRRRASVRRRPAGSVKSAGSSCVLPTPPGKRQSPVKTCGWPCGSS